MSETPTSTTDNSPTPSAEFERGARAAAEAMRFYFLDENEGPLHEDLSTEILEQHEAGAVAEALAEERRRLERLRNAAPQEDEAKTRAVLQKLLDQRFPRIEPLTPRKPNLRGDDAAVYARDDERSAIDEFIDLVVDAGFTVSSS
jgi:hypothetical protein